MYKYNIVSLDCVNNNALILFTTYEYNKALEYLSNYLEKTFDFNNWLKCYFESSNSVCIYQYSYFKSKQLIFKLQILKFIDGDNIPNEQE